MEQETLTKILEKQGYSRHTIISLIRGVRKPRGDVRYTLEKEYGIPFTVWEDIKSYIIKSPKKEHR